MLKLFWNKPVKRSWARLIVSTSLVALLLHPTRAEEIAHQAPQAVPQPAPAPMAEVPALALGMETPATHALVKEISTGTVLLSKSSNEPMFPSSMTKIMTVYYVLSQIKQGNHTLDDQLAVSENAYKTEGSRMFLELGEKVSIRDLLKGAIIQSGNDACVALAEGFHTHERVFAEKMTQMAHEMGAKNTFFVNSTGLPDPQHVTTAHDLALISERLILDFPEEYKIFAETEFTHNNIKQGNRNPLLYKNMGADGLKTGHTEKAGFGLVASVLQGDRRIMLVLNGLNSMNARSAEAHRLVDWAIKEYDSVVVAHAGQTVDEVDVAGGTEDTIPLIVKDQVAITLARNHKLQLTAHMVYKKPLIAPVDPNQAVATLVLKIPDHLEQTYDLYPHHEVKKAGFFKRFKSTFRRIIYGSNVGTR